MLSFTTAPFDADAELTGHAIVNLQVSTSEHDASVFAYLSEIEADGRARYVTEGALRMLHRSTTECPKSYKTTWPFRTFHRDDARRMTPGEPEALRFALLPISWKLMKGSRLRLSISGADADHFAQVPHGRPPRIEVSVGAGAASCIVLPFKRP
jgi:putative CocE/NonD family hydrolase